MYFDFVYGISVDTREKPTANRRESALRASESDLLNLTLASLVPRLARPFIGIVRANPVGAPAPPKGNFFPSHLEIISKKKHFTIFRTAQCIFLSQEPLGRRQDLPERSR